MFNEFLYTLRKRNVPVSPTEWLTLMGALDAGCVANLDDFYQVARAVLVKSESHYDNYDIAFQEYFRDVEAAASVDDRIFAWLKDPLNKRRFEEGRLSFDESGFEELFRKFRDRLRAQTGQHDGGSRWIGRGGTSPFGHSGYHPSGIRVGGESSGSHAVQIAGERRFRNYRNDVTLDVRQIKVALRGLRQLTRMGPEDELDLGETVEATARNVGDIELVWRRSRKNAVKVLLLMDAGGSMDEYASLCSQLFSAAHASSHFKSMQYYYFHNCVYGNLYKDIERQRSIGTEYVLRNTETDCKLVLVGDARMGSWELSEKYGAIDYGERNEQPGIDWLKRVAAHFTHRVWLNPVEPRLWIHPTIGAIGELFPMFPLTLDGLSRAVKKLVAGK